MPRTKNKKSGYTQKNIGNTPLIRLDNIFAKLESANPTGSVKDRIALEMIRDAEEKGLLENGNEIVEATSGNTGISLAVIGRARGYKVAAIIPRNASKERVELLKDYGTKIISIKPDFWRQKAVVFTSNLAKKNNYVFLNQYDNPANIRAHIKTGKEILRQLPSSIKPDFFVAGIGTGGTITGVTKVLRERFPKIRVMGIIPRKGEKIEGLKRFDEGFKPEILDAGILYDTIEVSEEEAIEGLKELIKKKIDAGVSSGAAYVVAKKLKGKVITIFPDGLKKYLSYPELGLSGKGKEKC